MRNITDKYRHYFDQFFKNSIPLIFLYSLRILGESDYDAHNLCGNSKKSILFSIKKAIGLNKTNLCDSDNSNTESLFEERKSSIDSLCAIDDNR